MRNMILDSSVGRACLCVWRVGWVGATTTHGRPLLGGATPPGDPPDVQAGA
ncbi:MAG: hypothetical protein Q8J65_06475 [Nitrosomonadales bacterium]|nr:hypothetical protein [Nitrosomonadales bacterium]